MKYVKIQIIEKFSSITKTPWYSSTQSLECLPQVFLTDERNANEKENSY